MLKVLKKSSIPSLDRHRVTRYSLCLTFCVKLCTSACYTRYLCIYLQQYDDDCQVYVSAPTNDALTTITRLSQFITDVTHWSSASWLRLNPAKTVCSWLVLRQQIEEVSEHKVIIISTSITTVNSVRNIRVVLDSHLTM